MNPEYLKRYTKCHDKIKEISLADAKKLLRYILLIIFCLSIFFNIGSMITRWTFSIVPNSLIVTSAIISAYIFYRISRASTKAELNKISSLYGGINVMLSMLSIYIFSTNFLYLWTLMGNIYLIGGFIIVNIVFVIAGYYNSYKEKYEKYYFTTCFILGVVLLILVMFLAKYVDLGSFNSFKFYIANYIEMNLHYIFLIAVCAYFSVKNSIWLGRYISK